jgi:methionine-S-sulfoxide reductase
MKKIYVAGGCFWGVEKYFAMLPGVKQTTVGYANGKIKNPTYEQVCHDDTGHVETVAITYDPTEISLEEILLAYYQIIDPTALNKQGGDIGKQYRTGVYYTDITDEERIKKSLQQLQLQYQEPIVVENEALQDFYDAEEYHQNYLDKNPGGYCHIPTSFFTKKK